MTFMMLGEMFVEILRGDELQHCVPEELQPLVGAQRQVGKAHGAIGENPRQESDVLEFNT